MRVLGTHDPHVSLTWHRSLSIAHAGARVWSDGPSGGLNTTTTAPVVCLLVHFCRGGGGSLFLFFVFCVVREGDAISTPARGPWTCPDRRVLDRRGGRRKGYVCTRGTRMEGGTRMDTEGYTRGHRAADIEWLGTRWEGVSARARTIGRGRRSVRVD